MWDMWKAIERMRALAQELESTTVVGEGCGGKVQIVLSGHQQVRSVKIAPELLNDVATLEQGIAEAFHDARDKLQSLVIERLGGDMPPFFPGFSGGVGIG